MVELLIVLTCLGLNAIFSACETAFVSVSKSELRSLAKQGVKGAQTLLALRQNPERTLSIIQVGITLVGVLAAAVGGAGAAESIEPIFIQKLGLRTSLAEVLAILLVVLPLTYLSVVGGELVPKTLALRHSAKIALAGARWLLLIDRIMSPLVSALEWSTKKILSTFFQRSRATDLPQDSSIEIGMLSPLHREYVINMADIERKQIKDLLRPWKEARFVSLRNDTEEVSAVVIASGHTRLPVIDDGNVIGVLHTKEFLMLRETGEKNWQSLIRPTIKIKTLDSALGVLRLLQEKCSHLAVVYNSTGERVGIVTLEDIIEEVVGEIYDEDDDGHVERLISARAKSKLAR